MMRSYTAIIEKDADTGLYVGYVPGFPGAHSQGETLDELHENLREVIEMLLEDNIPALAAEFVGTQQIVVGLRRIAQDIGLTVDEMLNR
jgi:predicted RNase H-like HicB family nuclease